MQHTNPLNLFKTKCDPKDFIADLHTHTTASDGVFTPSQVVALASEHKVNVLAISDHDTTGGVQEAMKAGETLGVQVLCAVEVSSGKGGETHVLGYGKMENASSLQSFFANSQNQRKERTLKILAELAKYNMPLDLEALLKTADGSIGRPHIAREMLRMGYVQTMEEAFQKWLGNTSPAYVPREKVETVTAIHLLRDASFVPVLAHPSLLRVDDATFYALLDEWQSEGLMGVEVYHPCNRAEKGFAFYEKIARKRGLLVTGGSDFHSHQSQGTIGDPTLRWKECQEDVERLLMHVNR